MLCIPRNSTSLNIGRTSTFRLGSSKILNRWGTNLQNIESSLRRIYLADIGKLLIQVDQSGAEALIVAYLCRQGNFRDLFIHDIKPHVFVALHLFKEIWKYHVNKGTLDIKCDIDELCNTPIPLLKQNPFWYAIDTLIKSSDLWPAKERYYYIAKQVCHSSNYGVGPNMFSLNTLEKSKGKIVITKKEAEKYLNFYHSLFPEIREWHEQVKRQLDATGYLFNLFGYPRYFHKNGKYEETMFKEAFAFVPQSTVATLQNIACTRFQDYIEEFSLDWDLLTNTHDSALSQAPEDESMTCAITMSDMINNQELIAQDGTKFKMKSECAIGLNWAPYIEGKNENGLKKIKL